MLTALCHVSPDALGAAVAELERDSEPAPVPTAGRCVICGGTLARPDSDHTGLAHEVCAARELADCRNDEPCEYDVADGPFADEFTEWVKSMEATHGGPDVSF